MHKKICIIHKHSFAQIEFTCSLMFNEFLLQFKANIETSCLKRLIKIRVPQKNINYV
jgi:hypothetical protein